MSNDDPEADEPTFPSVAHAGSKAGIAAVFAYLKGRARLFPHEPQANLSLKHYTLLDKLGEGAMGVVFLAADTQLMRKVAIKVLRTPGDRTARARLLREAQNLAQLNHPHVLHVYEVGEHRDEIYMVMEYVEGAPLDVWLAEHPPNFAALLAILLDVGRGLAAAHARGLVHRDVKPANILIHRDGRALIGDFGLAWLDGPLQIDPYAPRAADRLRTLSQGAAGTPAYMSPEQFDRPADIDARSDLFSFCVVVWEAVHGQRPFVADTVEQTRDAVRAGRLTAPTKRLSGTPARLERILRRGLAARPNDRYPDMPALLAALDGLRQRRSLLRLALAAAFGGAVVLAGSQVAAGTCQDHGDLDALWSPTIRAELTASLPVADRGVADALVQQLDAFADDLRDSRKTLCETHRDASLGDTGYARAQLCLDERQDAFRAVLAALRDADVPLAVAPDDLADALGSVAHCRDPQYMAADVAPPTAEQQRDLAEVRGMRRAGEAALLRGQYLTAAGHFRKAVERARTVAYAPATAQALYDLGRTHFRLRRGRMAADALHEAQILADGARDGFVAADASLLLTSAAVASHDLEAAAWHEQETLARLRQSKRDRGGLLGEVELSRADRLLRQDRVDDAADALAAARHHLEDDPPESSLWRFNLPRMEARLALARGRADEAAARTTAASAALVAFTGSDQHPLYAEELGRSLLDAGDLEAAERELTRARRLYVDAVGPDSPHVVSVDVALARLHDARGESDEVAAIAGRADAILQRHPDEPMTLDDRVAVALYLGRERVGAKKYAEAAALFTRGLAPLEALDLPIQAENFALLSASLADILVNVPGLRDVPRARRQIAEALERWPAARWPDDPRGAVFVLRVAADVALAAADPGTARARAEAGLALLPEAPDAMTDARLRYILAQALGRDAPAAREHAAAALATFERLGPSEAAGEVRRWLDARQ